MQTPGFRQTINIPHRCSATLFALYILSGLVVLVSLLAVTVEPLARVLALACALFGGTLSCRQLYFLYQLQQIQVQSDQLSLLLDNREIPVVVVGSALVQPWLIAFSCISTHDLDKRAWRRRRMHIVLLPDSVAREHHRQLRVLLNTGKLHALRSPLHEQ